MSAPVELVDVLAGDVVELLGNGAGGKVDPMFWKIVQWAQVVVALIREAEDLFGAGRGEEKKAHVMTAATRELEFQATAVQARGCSGEEVGAYVSDVVDGVVGLFNCFGVFRRSVAGAPPASSTDAAGSSPPGPGSA